MELEHELTRLRARVEEGQAALLEQFTTALRRNATHGASSATRTDVALQHAIGGELPVISGDIAGVEIAPRHVMRMGVSTDGKVECLEWLKGGIPLLEPRAVTRFYIDKFEKNPGNDPKYYYGAPEQWYHKNNNQSSPAYSRSTKSLERIPAAPFKYWRASQARTVLIDQYLNL